MASKEMKISKGTHNMHEIALKCAEITGSLKQNQFHHSGDGTVLQHL